MSDECISPLRRRMIEDMTVRKFTLKTQNDYIRVVKKFAIFLGRSPDTASNARARSSSVRTRLAMSSAVGRQRFNDRTGDLLPGPACALTYGNAARFLTCGT